MKMILEGVQQQNPEAMQILCALTEDCLINPSVVNERLKMHNIVIDRIETVNGEKVIYVKESKTNNLLNG